MDLSASNLPEDVTALKAMVLSLQEKSALADAEVAELKALHARANERIERLNAILKALERGRFGRRCPFLDRCYAAAFAANVSTPFEFAALSPRERMCFAQALRAARF